MKYSVRLFVRLFGCCDRLTTISVPFLSLYSSGVPFFMYLKYTWTPTWAGFLPFFPSFFSFFLSLNRFIYITRPLTRAGLEWKEGREKGKRKHTDTMESNRRRQNQLRLIPIVFLPAIFPSSLCLYKRLLKGKFYKKRVKKFANAAR